MTISGAAIVLKKELANPLLDEKKISLSESFLAKLDELIALRCTKICKDGGGNPECTIRKCCLKKRIDGCWDCDNFESCDKLKDQYIHNIKQIKELGLDSYIKERCE